MSNLQHALYGAIPCQDSDCELHYPEIAVQEGVMNETELAYFIVGLRTGTETTPRTTRIRELMELARNVYDESQQKGR